jgi:excisionase family DNA binding protein
MRTGPAAEVLGVSTKTVERMVDSSRLRGGWAGSHRWVDPAHVVQLAVEGGRRAWIPDVLQRFLPGAEPDPEPPDQDQL